jgi:DNA excision repair protein ERCC-4
MHVLLDDDNVVHSNHMQAEIMCRHYKYPCLLIEFSKERNSMMLQSPSDISTDSIQSSSISSKLAMLALAFPNLRYLWSK